MRSIMAILVIVLLMGCQATQVSNVAQIKTKVKLNKALTLPANVPVAFYVDRSKPPGKNINFYGKLEEATEFVTNEMFTSAEKITSDSQFAYLIKLKATSDWDRMWGGWKSNMSIEVVSPDGKVLYKEAIDKQANGSGGLYDMNAIYNSFAGGIKEMLIGFLNRNKDTVLTNSTNLNKEALNKPGKSIKELFSGISPSNSGSSFFINKEGVAVTAAHVVDECIFYEMNYKGETLPAEILHKSRLLDLAVVKVDYANNKNVTINNNVGTVLGKQVFVTGYPLSGMLADYPSLTVGNVSSKGGLKGSQGYFQYSAPTQPGNSGGAITDYKGNLMGVVSSSLNQAMMLQEAGTTAQNVNFGVEVSLLQRFLDKHNVQYKTGSGNANFEQASADAVEYSAQILCYQ